MNKTIKERARDLTKTHYKMLNPHQFTHFVEDIYEFVDGIANAPEAEPVYVPIEVNPHAEVDGRHPNDRTPLDPHCQAALSDRGDDEGQGLDTFWKWGFREGWRAARKLYTAPPPPKLSDERILEIWRKSSHLTVIELVRDIEREILGENK